MKLALDSFKRNFGTHPIPQILQDLLDFQNASDTWYSDSFELAEIPKTGLQTYFEENEKLLTQFLEFGQDGNGSTYAFWLYQDVSLEKAPIVYFNSEGSGNTVVAHNLAVFLILLTWDQELVLGSYPDDYDLNKHTERNQEFRAWVQKRLHLHTFSLPNDIIQQARSRHPDLNSWIEKNC